MPAVTDGQLAAWFAAYFWPFVRILALFSAAPLFSHRAVPVRVKIGLAAACTLLLAPGLPAPAAGADPAWLLVQQLAIGLSLGFALHLVFAAFELAGELLGLQMGLSFATFVDPQNAHASPLVGSFFTLVATLVFLAMNGHLLVLAGLAESFHAVPIGAAAPTAADWKGLALLGGDMFRVGLHLALPVVAAMLVLNLALGVLARAAPQLNLFAVGFPASILAGLLALALLLPFLGAFFEASLERAMATALKAVLR